MRFLSQNPHFCAFVTQKSYTRFNGFFLIADSSSKYIVNIHKKLSELYLHIKKILLYSGNNHKERNVLPTSMILDKNFITQFKSWTSPPLFS